MRKETIGTIKGNNLLINRSGKVTVTTHPEIRGKVHKSIKDYDRQRGKRELRKELDRYC